MGPRKVKLTFGERMREWRKARKEFADKVKTKVKEDMEIKDNHPPLPKEIEGRSVVTSPTETTEMKTGEVGPIPQPANVLEQAINILRAKAAKL